MKISYTIEMLSDWHVGSGLDLGADADILVLKNEYGLPYIPGKTIKGLLKDSLNEICAVSNSINIEVVNTIFGFAKEEEASTEGKVYFSNAELKQEEKLEIITNKLSSHLFKNIASTRIMENGIAQPNSLRTMEVCIPLTLTGIIETEVPEAEEIFKTAFKWTRNLGVNRNRGLGRCKFSIIS